MRPRAPARSAIRLRIGYEPEILSLLLRCNRVIGRCLYLLDEPLCGRLKVEWVLAIRLDAVDALQVLLRLSVARVAGQSFVVLPGCRREAPRLFKRHSEVVVECRHFLTQFHGLSQKRERGGRRTR